MCTFKVNLLWKYFLFLIVKVSFEMGYGKNIELKVKGEIMWVY